jgi:hypothetical protein
MVSFDNIKEGDNFVNVGDLLDPIPIFLNYKQGDTMLKSSSYKIIAHRPLNGKSIIPSIQLLPELKINNSDSFPTWFDGTDYVY